LPMADEGLQINVGAEWREEESAFLPDYISQQGAAAGSGGATVPVTGEFSVSEAFTELRLPIASHQFLAEDLSVEAGYRYSKYNNGFDTNTYKVGLDWAPTKDVRLRGSYQRAVRAPNIGELYTPQAVGLDGSFDPCAGALAPGSTTTLTTGATFAQCKNTGVTLAQFGHISANSSNQYNGLLGGNANLKPEIADTYTAGIVFTPQFVQGLNISLDYFNINIKNVIEILGENTILNDCVASDEFCNDVHRAPGSGSLWLSPLGYVTDTNVNEGELRTRGVDVKLAYRQPLPALGSLLLSMDGTRLLALQTTPMPGAGAYDCAGYFGATCGGNDSKFRAVTNLTWSTPWDGADINLRWRYFGNQESELLNSSPYLAGSPYLPLAHIAAYSYFDLSVTFNVYKNVRLQLGANNITDKAPPLVTGSDCSTSSPGGANCNGNTFPGVYDAMGRYLFAHITAQF
jgi:iron complex outermembrane receptor protein